MAGEASSTWGQYVAHNSSTLTARLIELIRQRAITEEARESAALFILDALANAIAARSTDPGRILMRWAGTRPAHPATQAFLLGGLTHTLETDDLHRASVTHPGCVVVPVALALGGNSAASGHALLRAVLHGYEAMCRVGNAVGAAHYRVWHNTATCGPYGSAMCAADLLGLSDSATLDALGNAGTQSSGLWQFLETGAMSKHLHAARAAESGLLAAELASFGFTGPPAILEGPKGFFVAACPDAAPEAVLAQPDADWQLRLTSIKPWPSCRHTHPCIDAALELRSRLEGRQIASVRAETYQAALDVCDRPSPANEYEAKFSLQHCIAVALAEGHVDFESFSAGMRDRLAALRQCVSAVAAEPFRALYPHHWGARITVTTQDGLSLSVERRDCKGDPGAALSRDAMIEKALMLMRYGRFPEPRAQALVHAVLELPANRADWTVLRDAIPSGSDH